MKSNLVASAIAQLSRKVSSALDRPYSQYQLKRVLTAMPSSSTYFDRKIYRELLPALLGSELVVYDIGAYRGNYIHAIAKLHNVARVIGFEPIPDCYAEACKLLEANEKVTIYNYALGDTEGRKDFFLNDSPASSSILPMLSTHKELFPKTRGERLIEVDMARLDNVVVRNDIPLPDVIKIDVQGYEDVVMRGGEKTFAAANYLLIELSFVSLYEGAPTAFAVINRLVESGWNFLSFSEPLMDELGRWASANALFEKHLSGDSARQKNEESVLAF